MNREIKFRGKRVDNGEWIYGYLVQGEKIDSVIMTGDYHANSGVDAFEHYEVIPETVGQFTGMHVTGGKEIWEGDILFPWCLSIGPYWIVFENGSFVCYHKDGRWGLLSRVFEADILRDYSVEVIGNIHENPKLLTPSK